MSWNRLGCKYVSFKDCSFAVKKGREATARVVVARELGVANSYTVCAHAHTHKLSEYFMLQASQTAALSAH
jgi:hypothetical protein